MADPTTADTRTRILDATLAVASRIGLARLSLEDVAQEADLSRQTVYRYFGNRDALLTSTVLREEEAFLTRMETAVDDAGDLRAALEAAIAAALYAAREHPLLDRLLENEPESLLPFLTTGAGPLLQAAHPALQRLLHEHAPALSAEQAHRMADLATRLVVSYAINPPDAPVATVAAEIARLLVDGVGGLATQSPVPTSTA